MLYLFISHYREWFEAHGLGFLRVFTYPTFRAMTAIMVSFIVSIILGPRLIKWLRQQKISDLAGFDQVEIDKLMASKKGTPTMGGILIISAIVAEQLLCADGAGVRGVAGNCRGDR
jgi:phospho-N-acetylmuramoyl-pentapeptide-transferase